MNVKVGFDSRFLFSTLLHKFRVAKNIDPLLQIVLLQNVVAKCACNGPWQ